MGKLAGGRFGGQVGSGGGLGGGQIRSMGVAGILEGLVVSGGLQDPGVGLERLSSCPGPRATFIP